MNESKTRDKILKRIRQALLDKAPDPFPDINFTSKIEEYDEQEFPELLFAENLIAAGGHFTYCENDSELKSFLKHVVMQLNAGSIVCSHPNLKTFAEELSFVQANPSATPDISLSSCFCVTAFPPSVILSSSSFFHNAANHIIVASAHDAVHDLKSGLSKIKDAVRNGSENSFEIISFAENGNDENTGIFPARDFFIAIIDRKL